MRAVLYGASFMVMLGGSVGMGLLPRFASGFLVLAVVGFLLCWAISGAWLLLGATAGSWPRPRAGHALMLGGLIGLLVNAATAAWLAVIWSLLVVLAGVVFTYKLIPWQSKLTGRHRRAAGVEPPLRRRAQL